MWSNSEKWQGVLFTKLWSQYHSDYLKSKPVKWESKDKKASKWYSALDVRCSWVPFPRWASRPQLGRAQCRGGWPGSRAVEKPACCGPPQGSWGVGAGSFWGAQGGGLFDRGTTLCFPVRHFVNLNPYPCTLLGGRALKTTWDFLLMGTPGYSSIPGPW